MKHKKRESILWIEAAGFGSMLALIWAMELLHVPQFLFSEPHGMNLGRVGLRSAVILIVWGFVHVATRRLLKRLHHLEEYLRICAWCQKIGHDGTWMTMQQYMGSNFETKLTHGVCPECSEGMVKTRIPAVTPS